MEQRGGGTMNNDIIGLIGLGALVLLLMILRAFEDDDD